MSGEKAAEGIPGPSAVEYRKKGSRREGVCFTRPRDALPLPLELVQVLLVVMTLPAAGAVSRVPILQQCAPTADTRKPTVIYDFEAVCYPHKSLNSTFSLPTGNKTPQIVRLIATYVCKCLKLLQSIQVMSLLETGQMDECSELLIHQASEAIAQTRRILARTKCAMDQHQKRLILHADSGSFLPSPIESTSTMYPADQLHSEL